MYERVLVPLDGSKLSEGILPYVRALARALKLPVELLHVNDPAQLPPYAPPIEGAQYLEKIASSFSDSANVKCTVELGNPAALIIDLAALRPETLIAMATHGYSGAKRWLLGSITEKVLHAANSDLLLIRPANGDSHGEAQLKMMIVPLDGSVLAAKALPTVSELAPRLVLEVLLVRVAKRVYTAPPEAFLPVFGANVPDLKQLWQEAKSEANRHLF